MPPTGVGDRLDLQKQILWFLAKNTELDPWSPLCLVSEKVSC